VTVLTLGTFDLLHAGHLRLFARCRQLAGSFGTVTVALNSDEFIEAYKSRAPVQTYAERRAAIHAAGGVDVVVKNSQGTPGESARPTILDTAPDLIVVGSDWRDRDFLGQLGVAQEWLDARDCYVVFVPYTPGISTTMLREAMTA
jgi:cytidyltransferase-like protein